MTHFAPPLISMTCGPGAKPIVSLGEMNPVDFAGFPPHRSLKRNGREIHGDSEACAAPRLSSLRNAVEGQRRKTAWQLQSAEMAPQAIEITRNGRVNGAAGSQARRAPF